MVARCDEQFAVAQPLHRIADRNATRNGERFVDVHLGVAVVYGRRLGGQLVQLVLAVGVVVSGVGLCSGEKTV